MPPLVFLSDLDDIRAVLKASPEVLHPGAGAAVIAPLVGKSSFMLAEEEEHMSGRGAVVPAFRNAAVREHSETIQEIVSREVSSWPHDRPFALHPHLRALSLKVILRTVFGEEDSILRELHKRLLIMLSATASLVIRESWLRHLPGWHATWKEFVKQRQLSDELIFSLIGRKKREGPERGDLLDVLLAAHNPDGSTMSERQVRDHLMSVILAGHETTAAELAWAFQLLAHNRTVQDRLIDEIDDQADERYLTATVQEVLRHRPVFLFTIPRVVVQPIEIGGFTYHPPVQLLGCIYLVHHDSAIYPDPQRFSPERFLPEVPEARTWLPWGGGRKYCPGHRLATLEMQIVLRAVLSTSLVLPASPNIERPRWRSVIVTPHAGSRVILHRRCR
jgi:hypothetical protein